MAQNDEEREYTDQDEPTSEEDRDGADDYDRDRVESNRGAETPKSKIPTNAGDFKGMAAGAAANAAKNAAANTPGVGEAIEKAEEVKQNVEKANKVVQGVKNGAQAVAGFAKGFVAFVINPWFYVTVAIILAITLIVITSVTSVQVYGTTKTTSTSGASGEMLERLAQRADWLQKNYTEHGETTGPLYELAQSPKSNLSANEWRAACPNIVAFIYGLSPYLINYNGNWNAYKNWKNHPELYESYAFSLSYGDGSASPGAALSRPPAGAIVSIQYGTEAGHTFVMLTDELVIDNWSGGGILFGQIGGGPRVISDAQRAQIVGWALPKSEGFEGTFITGTFDGAAEGAPAQEPMPKLEEVPEWAKAAG